MGFQIDHPLPHVSTLVSTKATKQVSSSLKPVKVVEIHTSKRRVISHLHSREYLKLYKLLGWYWQAFLIHIHDYSCTFIFIHSHKHINLPITSPEKFPTSQNQHADLRKFARFRCPQVQVLHERRFPQRLAATGTISLFIYPIYHIYPYIIHHINHYSPHVHHNEQLGWWSTMNHQ